MEITQIKKMKVETVIDFCGFYETSASERVAEEIFANWWYKRGNEEYIEEWQLNEKDQKDWDDFWGDVEYNNQRRDLQNQYILQYAKNYFDELHNLTDVKIDVTSEDLELHSPQYYNFTTDRIFVKVEKEKLMELYKKLDKVKFAEKIKEQFTDRPGFASFYPNDIADSKWQDVENFDHNQWLTVLQCFIGEEQLEDLDNDIYIQL